MKIRFLGTGTSVGVPQIGCECPVCTSSDPRNRRRRTGIHLSTDSTAFLVDAPPEMREACLEYHIDKVEAIERSMGRTGKGEMDAQGKRIYHSRTIDIDILFIGAETIDSPRLTVPHKGISDRPFVLVPLREVARPALKKAFPGFFVNSTI
jgi:2-amino-4-hydroxy-6-hydroxymethyldihydropteridine diphosphokinase